MTSTPTLKQLREEAKPPRVTMPMLRAEAARVLGKRSWAVVTKSEMLDDWHQACAFYNEDGVYKQVSVDCEGKERAKAELYAMLKALPTKEST